MYTPRQKIMWFAFNTRLAVIMLQAMSNFLIPDHNAHVFVSPEDPTLRKTHADVLIDRLLGGFKRWDAQYFIHIAQYGYTHENTLAFFPLFPMIIRYFAYGLNSILGAIFNFHSLLLLSATVINLLLFIKSADILYKLSIRVLQNECIAYKSAILYCVNPASIFFSAPYSETLFALLSFYTMLKCTDNETIRFSNIDITTGIPAGLSMITRSNGSVNLGFIMYTSFKGTIERTLPEIVYKYKTLKNKIYLPFLLLPLFMSVAALFLSMILAVLPFLVIQSYNYLKYCVASEHNLPEFLVSPGLVLPGSASSPWCNDTLPISYSFIQSHYWQVGPFKYYKVKQIPNFLLASPILLILVHYCTWYIRKNVRLCFRLGLKSHIFNLGYMNKSICRARQYPRQFGANESTIFVYVVHILFLTIFSMIFVHIQVSTRLLASASPILYWICCSKINVHPTLTTDQNNINEHFRKFGTGKRIPAYHLSIANLEGIDNMYSKWKTFIIVRRMPGFQARFIQCYFIGYFVMGTVLFSNFYPWT